MGTAQAFGIGYSMTMLGIAIAIVIVLCICFKIHAFVSLTTASLFLALTHNMELAKLSLPLKAALVKLWVFLRQFLRWEQYWENSWRFQARLKGWPERSLKF